MVAMGVRWLRSRRRPNLHPHAWIADDDDQAAIGDPLARIIGRRAPAGTGAAGDVVDGLEAGAATAAFALRSLQLEADSPPVIDVDGGLEAGAG